MEAIRQLTRQQHEEFVRIRNSQNGMDQCTFDLCLKYFLEYKHNIGNISSEKLPIAFKTALFMAQKSQNIQNLKGERIFLPSITLGQVLKTHQVDQFMITLKDFSKHVKITDKEAAADMLNLIREISFLITFHKKFDKSVQKLELKERQPESSGTDYLKNWSSFAWLLYIQIKNKAFHKTLELIENTCLLAHTIAFMLVWAWQYVVPKGILKNEFKINQQSSCKDVMAVLRDRILQMFSIKTMDMYASIANKFQTFFELELEKKGIVKSNFNNFPSDFLSPDLLPQNYRRLDKLYQRSLGPNDLDQRIFFRERLANLTPSKFTPFARQGYANKGRKLNQNDNPLKQNFSSHRILNYEMIDKQQITIKNINEGINISKLPKTVLASPSTMKVQLICQTPITMGMQMFNYVNQKNRKFKQLLNQGQVINRPYQAEVVKHIEIIYEKGKKDFDRKTKEIRQDIIFSLFKLVLEEYINQYPNEKDNIHVYEALMAISMEVVLFVCNSTLTFEDVEKEVNTTTFQLWKACHFFLKFDKSMPSALKLHLLDVQVSLISYKLWADPQNLQIINKLSKGIEQKEIDPTKSEFSDKLFRRVLHQIAYMINQLGSALKLGDSSIENIFQLMKTVYTQHTYLLQRRNIDQLIMCCIFALNKIQKLDLRFTDIIEVYKEVNQYNKDLHDSIIMQIAGKDKEFINLITFYNDFFAKSKVKEVIINFKNNNCENKKRVGYNVILQSPLKDILPRQLNKKNSKKATKDGNTNLLVSVTDSPLLKHEPLSFKGANPKTRKMIDFDQEERDYIKQAKQQQKSPRVINQVSNNQLELNKKNPQMQTSNFGNLPWKTTAQNQSQMMNMNINGLTPTRISKNIQHPNTMQLNGFNSNYNSNPGPVPMISKTGSNMPLKNPQMLINNFNKGHAKMNYQ